MAGLNRADELVAAFDRIAIAVDTPIRQRDLVRELAITAGWGNRPITAPLLPSGISHGVPWGTSIAIGSQELRVFVEAQADPPSPLAYWKTGEAMIALAAKHGADPVGIERLRAMTSGLIETYAAHPRPPRLWLSLIQPPAGPPRWHAYVTCPETTVALAVLKRAGVAFDVELRPEDRITIASVDLLDPARARVKAHVLMPNASPQAIARVHDRVPGAERGDAERFARAMLGPSPRRIWWLVVAGVGTVPSCALHFAARHLVPATVVARTEAFLADHAIDRAPFERARSLGDPHYVTFQRRDGKPRVTIYVAPNVRR